MKTTATVNAPITTAAPTRLHAPAKQNTRAQVRRLSHQLEAVFVNQLFQAMRASVPKDGFLGHTPGEDMFTSIMDDRLASEAADRMQRGLGESLYRQLARGLPPEPEGTGR